MLAAGMSSRQAALVAQPAARPAQMGARRARAPATVCAAQQQQGDLFSEAGRRMAAAGAAALLLAAPLAPCAALASEFDLLASGTPDSYVVDDAGVLNKTTEKSVGEALRRLEGDTGFRLEVATVRRLEFEPDAFVFGDKLVGKWFPGGAADKRGVLLVVTAAKDGALTGGKAFAAAVGDELVDSVVGDNLAVLAEEEKYNEAVSSSVDRVVAKLTGKADPGPPVRATKERRRTYKTKAETQAKKPVTGTIVLTLLMISFVVPMLQYFGYTNKD